MKTRPRPLTCTSTKMNLGLAHTLDWLDQVILPQAGALSRLGFFACLPYPLITAALDRLAGSGITVGAQNAWPHGGPVTGEVSAALLAEVGCRQVMLGHAERRRLFGENDELVARKAAAVSAAGMVPLVCVGETRRIGAPEAAQHAARQTKIALKDVPEDRPAIVLYEPAWAIGSPVGASPQHAAEVFSALRATAGGSNTRIVYGGAVVPGTYIAIRSAADWDGVAVGRAAQDASMLHEVTNEMLKAA